MRLAWRRIEAALRTWPDRVGWNRILFPALSGLAAIALIAWTGGLVSFRPMPFGMLWLRVGVLLFFIPVLGEELVFRALLIPRPDQDFPLWRAVFAVVLFVAWHPFQALTIRPAMVGAFSPARIPVRRVCAGRDADDDLSQNRKPLALRCASLARRGVLEAAFRRAFRIRLMERP